MFETIIKWFNSVGKPSTQNNNLDQHVPEPKTNNIIPIDIQSRLLKRLNNSQSTHLHQQKISNIDQQTNSPEPHYNKYVTFSCPKPKKHWIWRFFSCCLFQCGRNEPDDIDEEKHNNSCDYKREESESFKI